MTIRETLLQEFDLELPFTQRSLERVPLKQSDWKPHERSMTLGWLATFIALCPTWGVKAIEVDEFDPVAMSGGKRPDIPTTSDVLMTIFKKNFSDLRAAIEKTDDAHLLTNWTLKSKGEVWFTKPRWLVLREFIFNHIVHHRAQLGVYLRMLDVPVPAIYNDSADEQGGVFPRASVVGATPR